MVHVIFDPNTLTLTEFDYKQCGGGANDYNYFHGTRPYMRGYGYYQNGAGLGSILRILWRAILPSMKSAGVALGKEALSTGVRALEKVGEGKDIKNALVTEAVKGVDNLLERGGMGRQFGTGKRLKIKKRKQTLKELVGRSVVRVSPKHSNKRQRSDAFGFY